MSYSLAEIFFSISENFEIQKVSSSSRESTVFLDLQCLEYPRYEFKERLYFSKLIFPSRTSLLSFFNLRLAFLMFLFLGNRYVGKIL